MLGQGFSDPAILAFVGAHEDDEVVAGGIVGVEEVRGYAQEAEATGDDDELILFAKLSKDVLLEFLCYVSDRYRRRVKQESDL